MPRLVLKTEHLFSDRVSQIRALLQDVAADASSLQIRPRKHSVGHIIAASDAFNANDLPTEQLFATTSEELYGQYYEIWKPDQSLRNYHLYQNYFHLYAMPSKNERDELFCLHAEPQESLDAIVDRVRAGPHIHVKTKEGRLRPVAKAHLPLCYSTVDAVLKSVKAFDEEFGQAMSVIRHEVVDRYV